ncbi:hypothetical protein RJ639_043257 [Escallonia herrerae]|uniref:SOSEKI DIX-like domain-containing protein n=1 Tax=Escallonia herrerae TaxID=1293975 RepID=A0AA88WD81_9ASTE|nr:hypothetical protein RJ639_043257 [Escallonia herrerae]
MEAQGGGEVRRVHIIYFLSRKGRSEHPHLIRVHHLSRNGVRLRDVKRWLSELRGKDVAESHAWSYKRKYKAGYVWQDLLDEDLITPISDNEYVLKGSEIAPTNFDAGTQISLIISLLDYSNLINSDKIILIKFTALCSYGEKEKELPRQKEPNPEQKAAKVQEHPEKPMDMSKKASCEIEEESPPFGSETSTLTEGSPKLEEDKHSDTTTKEQKLEHYDQKDKVENPSLYPTFLNENKKSKKHGITGSSSPAPSTSPASEASYFAKSRSYSNGASHMFRSLITCGAVDTNDTAMVMINRRNKTGLNMPTNNKPLINTAEIFKGEKWGGYERINGNQKQQQNSERKSWEGVKKGSKKNMKSEVSNQKTVSAAYKPVNGPNCSQCGKPFKPEKLHAHMKSCRKMKALAKGTKSADAERTPNKSTDTSSQDSVSGYYLTKN